MGWSGTDTTASALAQVADLVGTGLCWDLVLAYRNSEADIRGWAEFAARVVTEYGTQLAAIQVTGEANLTGIPDAGDGAYPGAAEALVHGVLAAAAKQEGGLPVAIGFAVVPEADPGAGPFWPAVAALGGAAFAASVDFAGVDMYPGQPDALAQRLGWPASHCGAGHRRRLPHDYEPRHASPHKNPCMCVRDFRPLPEHNWTCRSATIRRYAWSLQRDAD